MDTFIHNWIVFSGITNNLIDKVLGQLNLSAKKIMTIVEDHFWKKNFIEEVLEQLNFSNHDQW